MRLSFRPMVLDDIPFILPIELSAYPFPWTEDILQNCVKLGYECWVVIFDNTIIGYSVMLIAVDECHILNLCINPTQQQRGYGKALLQHILTIAKQKSVQRCLLEVRPSNIAAYQLYLQQGFELIGIRKAYYPAKDGREDALVLQLVLAYRHLNSV